MKPIDMIIARMESEPENFKLDRFYIDYKSQWGIWIASGFWFYRFDKPREFTFDFSFCEKIKFHIALKKIEKKLLSKNISRIKEMLLLGGL